MRPSHSVPRHRALAGGRLSVLTLALALAAVLLPICNPAERSARAANSAAVAAPGFWMVAADGGIFSGGDASFFGSTGAVRLNQPIVGMAATPSGRGYWLVASDGGIFSFGDASFFGSTGAVRLNKPIVGMAATPSGRGYWLVASDGGIFSFGDASFFGSTGAMVLNKPIVGMTATPTGRGYWLVASDGGLFSYGDARFFGSTGALRLNKPIMGMAATPSGRGYWLFASDGGLFSYGDAWFYGSAVSSASSRGAGAIVAMVPTWEGTGYWQIGSGGEVFSFGNASRYPSLSGLNQPIVGASAKPRVAGVTQQGVTSNPTLGSGGAIPTTTAVTQATTTTTQMATTTTSRPSTAGRPNILFFLLDDMRENGVMDDPAVLPKTKQWLQQGGTTFTEAFTTTSLCCPERATLWSGRYEHNHGVLDNQSGDNLDRDWISPRYLQDAGYNTSIIGKFITDWKFRYEPPHFDEYAATQGGYVDAKFWVKNPGDTTHHTEYAPYSTDWMGDKAAEFIDDFEAKDSQPWFMQVSPHAPHDTELDEGVSATTCEVADLYDWPARYDNAPIPPWQPTPAVTVEAGPNMVAEKADKVPYLRNRNYTQACGANRHEGQMRTLMPADDLVDTVMKKLQANGELSNTLIIFTTDNGYSWDERGVPSKGLPYTEHVKAPFLVRWDGVFPAGGIDNRLVGGEDMLPTYLDAIGYTPPVFGHPIDGRSFLPGRPGKTEKLLEFGPIGIPSPDTYVGHRSIPTWASLRTADWQYIEYYADDNTTIQWREYYDLRADPWELENLLYNKTTKANIPNPPAQAAIAAELHRVTTCAGTAGTNPCP